MYKIVTFNSAKAHVGQSFNRDGNQEGKTMKAKWKAIDAEGQYDLKRTHARANIAASPML